MAAAHQPSTFFMNKRNGKIARLPKDLRELINRMLDDGAQYQSIINELDKHRHRWPDGVKAFTDGNLSEWHQGGYQDWVHDQETRADLQARREHAQEVDPGADVPDMVHDVGSLRLYHLLVSTDRDALEAKVRDNPTLYARLLNAYASLSHRSTNLMKYKEHVRHLKERIVAELNKAAPDGSLSSPSVTLIQNELKLL